jgi:hypothetical protein
MLTRYLLTDRKSQLAKAGAQCPVWHDGIQIHDQIGSP